MPAAPPPPPLPPHPHRPLCPDRPWVRGARARPRPRRSFSARLEAGRRGPTGTLTPGRASLPTPGRTNVALRGRLGPRSPTRLAGCRTADSPPPHCPGLSASRAPFRLAGVGSPGGGGCPVAVGGESRCAGALSAQTRSCTLLRCLSGLSDGKGKSERARCWSKGNNTPESDLKARDANLFNVRCCQEWLFFHGP